MKFCVCVRNSVSKFDPSGGNLRLKAEVTCTFMCYKSHLFVTGIGKKMDAAAKKKNCEELAQWKQSVVNHVYWCAASSAGKCHTSPLTDRQVPF